MSITKILLLIALVSATYTKGCYSCHDFVMRTNHLVTNAASVAQEYYKSNDWMKNGQVRGKMEPNSYGVAYDFLKKESRAAYAESDGLDLAALFTVYHMAKNNQMSHNCFGSPGDRAEKFTGNKYVGENIAWASNVRSCEWCLLAWTTDDGIPSLGHRNNLFGKHAMTGLSANGYYYCQQTGDNIEPKAEYKKDYRKFGIFTKYDKTIVGKKWDRLDA